MEEITLKSLAALLQVKIDRHMGSFMEYRNKVNKRVLEIELLEKKMTAIVYDLEPVESLIYNQNPQLKKIFESLKRVYGEDKYGTNRKVGE